MKDFYENLCFAIGLLLVGSSFANDNPVYKTPSAELVITNVQVDSAAGAYQDVRMLMEDDGTLAMLEVHEGVLLDHIHQVDVVRALTIPEQVFLEASGAFPLGCGEIGQIHQSMEDNHFYVQVYYKNDEWLKNPSQVPCTLAIRPFKKRIPLQVYGLPAGVYQYTVNNEFSGSFTLMTDNSIN